MRPIAALLAMTTLLSTPALAAPAPAAVEQDLYDAWIGRYTDLSVEGLRERQSIRAPRDTELSFSPSDARFYDDVVEGLGLTKAAQAQLERAGVVLVDPGRRYSMAAALYAIYTSDLPLLVTTDAVLDAVHRSFDTILAELEEGALRPTLRAALKDAWGALPELAKVRGLTETARDLDLYLTVALNLLDIDPDASRLSVAPRLADEAKVSALLAKVAKGRLENPGFGTEGTTLYGAARAVDWSQMTPRGHYARSDDLERYFRAVMWLGRADTGFELKEDRQLRAAAALTLILNKSGASTKLQLLTDVVDLFVGRSDDLSPAKLTEVLKGEAIDTPALAAPKTIAALREALAAAGLGRQRIRGQLVVSLPSSPIKVPPPPTFQLFGQRFILDSFVLSHVVYDDITFHGEKQRRRMPSPLDVMAALGNDLAVGLLDGELKRWHYSANLATLRDIVASRGEARWGDSLYDIWLDALRVLARPPRGGHIPEVMRGESWARKMLQTQLGSWAQLRHDTILYAKQSFTASVGCVYPEGYVEPYPAFYAKLGRFARRASGRLATLRGEAAGSSALIERHAAYFDRFAEIMGTLEMLATKELRAVSLSKADRRFLKGTIERRWTGEGYDPQPNWDGWYIDLIYRALSDGPSAQVEWKPTIADIHTDPDAMRALEVGTGEVHLAVVAIDNDGDRAIHVGPTFTYYEFTQPADQRLTDEGWARIVSDPSERPERPTWIQPLLGAVEGSR